MHDINKAGVYFPHINFLSYIYRYVAAQLINTCRIYSLINHA